MTDMTTHAFEVSPRALIAALNKVTPAAATTGDRLPELEQVLTYVSQGWLHLFGTDRYRIHHARVQLSSDSGDFDRPLPVSMAKDLKALGLDKPDLWVRLETTAGGTLAVITAEGEQGRYQPIGDPARQRSQRETTLKVRAILAGKLGEAAEATEQAETPLVGSPYLADALKAVQGPRRTKKRSALVQMLPGRQVLVSDPQAPGSFHALIMGIPLEDGIGEALSDAHFQVSAALDPNAPASAAAKSA